jgi:hypothetical protein
MPKFSFRLRFLRSPTDTLNINAPKWERRFSEDTPSLVLCSQKKEAPIKDADQWVLKSDGWASEDEAKSAAAKYSDALLRSLVRLCIGADFGHRAPKGALTAYGLAMLEKQAGQRVLNDVHGLMLYESEPQPRFASLSTSGLRIVSPDRFERVFQNAIEHPRKLSDRERVSMELFDVGFRHDEKPLPRAR